MKKRREYHGCEEEYPVLKRVRKYHGCEEEHKVEIREIGNYIIFPITLRLLGRISSGEKGKGMKISGKKIISKNEMHIKL